jgi:Uri superfamily endonuclease
MTQENPPGTYILNAELSDHRAIKVGSLGSVAFEKGYYLYVGSALSGLQSRLQRHLRMEKSLHWHIDYLLQYASVREILYHVGPEQYECAWADILHRMPGIEPSEAAFGASDCDCRTHLFYTKSASSIKAFREVLQKDTSLRKLVVSLGDPTEVDL